MVGLGTHILLDLYGCTPGLLNDLEFLRQMSLEGVRRSGATILGDHFKRFEPQGVSGVVIIAESHLSLHTWPEFSYIAMDYFTCGNRIDMDAAINFFGEQLAPKKVIKSKHNRGEDLLDEEWVAPKPANSGRPTAWFTEYHWEGEQPERLLLGYQYAMDRELVRTRSDHQEIMVMENPVYGKMLLLDGFVNTTEKDEFAYHEMLSHIPTVIHGAAQDVLIIGGGDGGLLREVLRHPGVRHVDLVEIDRRVVDVSKEHLPDNGRAFGDPRAHLHFQDGAQFIHGIKRGYDLILVDSTDPIGPGKVLYQTPFYRECRNALRSGGIFGAQALSAWIQEEEQAAMFSNLREVWDYVTPYVATVPTYPGGLWTFAIGSDRPVDPATFDRQYAADISESCRYYNPEIHSSAFSLPTFLQERLKATGPLRH
jgi:spermidine synthase